MKQVKKLKNFGSKKLTTLKVCLETLIVELQNDEMPLFEEPGLINYFQSREQIWTLSFCMDFYNSMQRGDISWQLITYNHFDYNVTKFRESIIKYQRGLSDDVLLDYRKLLKFGYKLCEMSQFFTDWLVYIFLKQNSSYRNPLLDEKSFLEELKGKLSDITQNSGNSRHIALLLDLFKDYIKSESISDRSDI
jgi:hypothetical protein